MAKSDLIGGTLWESYSHKVNDLMLNPRHLGEITAAQAEALTQAAEASRCVVQVGHIERFNPTYIERLEQAGLKYVGKSEDGVRMEVFQLKDHPYYVGCQFHPELKSRPRRPAPLFAGLVAAAMEYKHRSV